MILPKGGRGKKAPYETITVRIPVPIQLRVEAMAEQYRLSVLEGDEFIEGGNPTFDQALEAAIKVARQKKSGKDSLIKLLQVLYGVRVTKEMLD